MDKALCSIFGIQMVFNINPLTITGSERFDSILLTNAYRNVDGFILVYGLDGKFIIFGLCSRRARIISNKVENVEERNRKICKSC